MSRGQLSVMIALQSSVVLLAAHPDVLARVDRRPNAHVSPPSVTVAVRDLNLDALRLADFGDVESAR